MTPLEEIPVPSPPVPASIGSPLEQPSRSRWAVLPWLFVVVLAFLLGSFPARNSDLWLHLAAGKQLAQGEFPFTAPPGLPAGERINQTWLYNLLAYVLYSLLGGAGLVLVKAFLVAGLGLVLLRLCGLDRTGAWIAAGCTALALLAMSTRLLLQPATVSYLLLALTLWLLTRTPRPDAPSGRLLPPWPLLLLFVLWANLDQWFLLGLGTVALVWLGRVVDEAGGVRDLPRPLLGCIVSLALLGAACLLQPSGVRAFALPEAGWFGPSGQGTSPFHPASLSHLRASPAGLAYFPLLGLGLLSFILNLPRWRWQRFLPWLGLALLSAFQVRTIGFFAVVAGPVLAWNLRDCFARRAESERPHGTLWRAGVRVSRALGVVLGLALVLCAWPGWLQAPPFEPRRWAIETAPSLERGALATRRWHQEGRLGDRARALHLSAETACTFAWFCPEEKGLLDADLAAAVLAGPEAPAHWEQRLRQAGVNHVIVYDRDRGRLLAALDRLLTDPHQWPLLYLEGDLAVFGWRDPARSGEDLFRGWELNLNHLAFRPGPDRTAPRNRPDREPDPPRWWDVFWKPASPRQVDRDEAILHLLHAEALRRSAPTRHLTAWQASQSAALVGTMHSSAGPGGLLAVGMRLALLGRRPQEFPSGTLPPLDLLALRFRQRWTRQQDDTSPALLFLGVRAARRALAVNPADAQAYLVLGQCYLRLLHDTRERDWSRRLPELAQLRYAQASAALHQAVTLAPNLAQAHLHLSRLYSNMGYLDLVLEHQKTYLELTQAAPGSSEERDRLLEVNRRLAREVEKRRSEYTSSSAGRAVLDRAVLALSKGLAGQARDLLLESDVAAFGPRGMALELELLLRTGRAREVRDWTAPEQEATLGTPYHWLRAQALAATGDYALAEEECEELARSVVPGGEAAETRQILEALAMRLAQAVLEGQPGEGAVPHLTRQVLVWRGLRVRLLSFTRSRSQWADATVLRGLLALEEGEVDEARRAFRQALAPWQDQKESRGRLEFNGRPAALGCLEWLSLKDEG
jgi:tetratricopeptide (TPR) repeat protein